MGPHYSQSSHENATPSSGTSPLASLKGVPSPGSLAFLLGYSLCVADVLLFKVLLVQCQHHLLSVFLAQTALSKLMDHFSLRS